MSSPFEVELQDKRKERDLEEPLLPKRHGKTEPATIEELNLTSMLDVIFQLLIFFVLTASFAVGEGLLPADLPTGKGKAEKVDTPPARPVDIILNSDGVDGVRITVDGTVLTNFNALHQQLRTMHADNGGTKAADNPIILKPDRNVQWRHVVNAMNQCVRVRFSNVNFADPNS